MAQCGQAQGTGLGHRATGRRGGRGGGSDSRFGLVAEALSLTHLSAFCSRSSCLSARMGPSGSMSLSSNIPTRWLRVVITYST